MVTEKIVTASYDDDEEGTEAEDEGAAEDEASEEAE